MNNNTREVFYAVLVSSIVSIVLGVLGVFGIMGRSAMLPEHWALIALGLGFLALICQKYFRSLFWTVTCSVMGASILISAVFASAISDTWSTISHRDVTQGWINLTIAAFLLCFLLLLKIVMYRKSRKS